MSAIQAFFGLTDNARAASPPAAPARGQAAAGKEGGSGFAVDDPGYSDKAAPPGADEKDRVADNRTDPEASDRGPDDSHPPTGDDADALIAEWQAPSELALSEAESDPVAQALEAWTGISSRLAGDSPGMSLFDPDDKFYGADDKVPGLRDGTPHRPPMISADADETVLQTKPVRMLAIDAVASPDGGEVLAQPLSSQVTTVETMPLSSQGRIPVQHGNAVIQQITEALVKVHGEQIEIALSPEELGRLRLVISRASAVPHIQVWAERPEILDLIRRNSDLLLDLFDNEGAGSATLSFSSEGQEADRPQSDALEGEDEKPGRILTVAVAAEVFPRVSGDHHIDIRV